MFDEYFGFGVIVELFLIKLFFLQGVVGIFNGVVLLRVVRMDIVCMIWFLRKLFKERGMNLEQV